ncbi:hypothetical protein [uncultured Bacteroides sp.]|uniref:hypothetical protein n=1 Tax=uncultured Bacteroides sp. TaxID=162156 RepID=UPI002AA68C17|nr:hypothetical protein [uncultured Bacteroides sp.]
MKRKWHFTVKVLMALSVFVLISTSLCAQTEVMAWGNMTGIRVEGQLMNFESSFRIVKKDWTEVKSTGKEKQAHPRYHRDEASQTVNTIIDNIHFEQVVTDVATGKATVSVSVESDTTLSSKDVYFCLELADKQYADAPIKTDRKSIRIKSTKQQLELQFSSPVKSFIRKEKDASVIYVHLLGRRIRKGEKMRLDFTIHATGEIDHQSAEIVLDAHNSGRLFKGLGGNFRLQNPQIDPAIITYCLDSLRVAYGRVELPWRFWHSRENSNPMAEARAGKLDERVYAAMKMAQRLSAKGIPVIVSCWFPPDWAIKGDPKQYVRRGGVQAYRLDPEKEQKIYQSLTDYLIYLKQEYGVEAAMFSFNESDIGIDVIHTAKEHAAFIKGLGAYMASRGLSTKMLLGDNSDATTFDFILPALNDPETYQYIGAISFHSWRGCDDETLNKWASASRKLNVPLIVAEGSTDAAAHVYPEIFAESTFAFYEINLYTRLCAVCQPLSILQWQLTSDYSVLWGDGVYGSTGPLRPTQRYWNLKQLASTPEGAFAIPVTCNKEEVNCAAFGNIARGEYAIHMVNNGAFREVTIKGLPDCIKKLKVYVTNKEEGMQGNGIVTVEGGVAHLQLQAISFVTLITTK